MTLTPVTAELLVDSVIATGSEYAPLGREVRQRLVAVEGSDLSVVDLIKSMLDQLDAPLPDMEAGVLLTCLFTQDAIAAAVLEMSNAPVS